MITQHIFTLGTDHWHGPDGAYVEITGCDAEQARGIMFALHGPEWAFEYSGDERLRYLEKWPRAYCVQKVRVTPAMEVKR